MILQNDYRGGIGIRATADLLCSLPVYFLGAQVRMSKFARLTLKSSNPTPFFFSVCPLVHLSLSDVRFYEQVLRMCLVPAGHCGYNDTQCWPAHW